MFLCGKAITTAIQRAIEQGGKIDLAVAYWGKEAARELGLRKACPGVRIICDLLSGGTNPAEIRMLRKRFPGKIRHIPGLHAKVYLTDKVCIVGSSNASTNGLGNEGRGLGLIEAGYQSNRKEDVVAAADWFNEQWNVASPIKKSDLERAELAWIQRKHFRPSHVGSSPSSNQLFGLSLEDLSNRNIYVVVYQDGPSKEGRAVVKEGRKRHPAFKSYGYYEEYPPKGKDWVPLNSHVVDCRVMPKSGRIFVDRTFWATWEEYQADPVEYEEGGKGYIVWMRPQRRIQIGSKKISISPMDAQKIVRAIRRVPGFKTDDQIIPIEKLNLR